MRVLFWSELFWPYVGGAEIFGAGLMTSLQVRGHEFSVVTSHDYLDLPDEDSFEGIPVNRLPFRAALSGRDIRSFAGCSRRLREIWDEFNPDLVHINAIGPSALFYLRHKGRDRVPSILTMQQEALKVEASSNELLMSDVLRVMDWSVAVSNSVLDQIRDAVPSIIERSSCIHNGVQLPDVEPSFPDRPTVLYVGRLVPYKGVDLAIEAFARLSVSIPEARLIVAGDGPERDRLEGLAMSLGVEKSVEFLGWIEPAEVPALMNRGTVVVMPSHREGFPVTGVQAALMARPIVGSRVSGLEEIVDSGVTGFLVPVGDVDGLTSGIESLLGSPAKARSMGQAARKRIEGIVSWDRIAESYDALYRTIGG